jgi:hypothetical protein
MKGWFDRVFAYGEVYASQRRFEKGRYAGKRAMLSITVGTVARALCRLWRCRRPRYCDLHAPTSANPNSLEPLTPRQEPFSLKRGNSWPHGADSAAGVLGDFGVTGEAKPSLAMEVP